LARTDRGSGRRRIFVYSIPLMAIVILAGVYYVASLPPIAQESFTVQISIKVWSLNQTGGCCSSQYFVPPAIGVPGGIWKTTIYNGEGLAGNYPIYTDNPATPYPGVSIIHVSSKENRTYYLGDFFNVWGSLLGPNNTLGFTANPVTNTTRYRFESDWYWWMCVGPNVSSLQAPTVSWGKQPLEPNMMIFLFYSDLDPSSFCL